MKIGLIGAMEVEVKALSEALSGSRKTVISGMTFHEGTLYGKDVVVAQCGVGKVNAAMCAEVMIIHFGVTHVINSGVAGGLHPDLAVMDLVVSTDAMQHDVDAVAFGYKPCEIPGVGTVVFTADEKLVETVEKAYAEGVAEGQLKRKVLRGRVASGDVFVSDPEVKKQIIAKCNAACCEMEGASIAQVCYLNKVPFVIIRCISDLAEKTDEVYLEAEAAAESSFVTAKVIELVAE